MAELPDPASRIVMTRTRVAMLTLPELCEVVQQYFDAKRIAVLVEDRAPLLAAPRLIRLVELSEDPTSVIGERPCELGIPLRGGE